MTQNKTISSPVPFSTFLEDLKTRMQHVFRAETEPDRLTIHRGVPPAVLSEIMPANPL